MKTEIRPALKSYELRNAKAEIKGNFKLVLAAVNLAEN